MLLLKPSYEILKSQNILKDIELAARTCYKSEDKISKDNSSAIKLVKMLNSNGHRAMLEFGENLIFKVDAEIYTTLIASDLKFINFSHVIGKKGNRYIVSGTPRAWADLINDRILFPDITASLLYYYPDLKYLIDINSKYFDYTKNKNVKPIKMSDLSKSFELDVHGYMTVKFIIDRGISHELVRHRYPVSFAMESTRYVNYNRNKFGNEISYIIPNWVLLNKGRYVYKNNTFLNVDNNTNISVDPATFKWLMVLWEAEQSYLELTNKNNDVFWTPQQARNILPNSLKTEIIVKTTFNEWLHIFEQRANMKAHPQIREVMYPLFDEFKKKYYE